MLIGKEVLELNGKELLLRNPTKEDAAMLIQYLRTTCGETPFLSKEEDEVQITLEEEREFICQMNISEHSVMILAFLDGEFVGNCSFSGNNIKRQKHRVSMGIALFQKYTGMGIGKIMVEKLLQTAKEKGVEQMELEVAAENERAVHLYKKLGFQIYGTFPDNRKYKDGTYGDTFWMMKKLIKNSR